MHCLSQQPTGKAIRHVFCGVKHKAKVSVLIMTPHTCTVEEEFLAVRLLGFKNHDLCFAEIDCEQTFFTEVGQCIQLSLKSFRASGHESEVISM